MRRRHLRGVMAIERQVYPRPWSPNLFLSEMTESRNRCYLVAPDRPRGRRVRRADLLRGGGARDQRRRRPDPPAPADRQPRLLHDLILAAIDMGAEAVSLEVRVTNWGAQRAVRPVRVPPGRRPQELLPGDQRGRADHVARRDPHPGVPRAARRAWPTSVPEGVAPVTAARAPREGPRHRDLLRRDRRRGRRGRRGALEPDLEPGRPARAVRRRGARGRQPRARRGAEPPARRRRSSEAGCRFSDLDGVAVTVGPGLVGALLVGIAAAKAIALATRVPLIGVNHLEGHIWANFLEHGRPSPPYVCLVVSGGHTMLVHMPERASVRAPRPDAWTTRRARRSTRSRGSSASGSPAGRRWTGLAREGDPTAIRFPRAMADSGDYDFSLSGLKTAVLRYVQGRAARRGARSTSPTWRPRSRRPSSTCR